MTAHPYSTWEVECDGVIYNGVLQNTIGTHRFSRNTDWNNLWRFCAPLRQRHILRPLAQRFERNIEKVAILFAGKAAGTPCGDVMLFLVKSTLNFWHCFIFM